MGNNIPRKKKPYMVHKITFEEKSDLKETLARLWDTYDELEGHHTKQLIKSLITKLTGNFARRLDEDDRSNMAND